jgi:hypothetical protein
MGPKFPPPGGDGVKDLRAFRTLRMTRRRGVFLEARGSD